MAAHTTASCLHLMKIHHARSSSRLQALDCVSAAPAPSVPMSMSWKASAPGAVLQAGSTGGSHGSCSAATVCNSTMPWTVCAPRSRAAAAGTRAGVRTEPDAARARPGAAMTPLECQAVAALDLPQGCRGLQALFDPATGGARHPWRAIPGAGIAGPGTPERASGPLAPSHHRGPRRAHEPRTALHWPRPALL